MATGAGFITYSPDTRYGSGENYYLNADNTQSTRFTVPGSGTMEISEIGHWARLGSAGSVNMKLAIFTEDATNNCPESMVANSNSDALAVTSTSYAKKSHTYGTKPQVTGGLNYFLGALMDSSVQGIYLTYDGNSSVGQYKNSGVTYDTWPDGDTWHSHTDRTRDHGFYAVYSEYTPPAGALPFFSEFCGGLNNDMRGGM